MSGLLPNDQGFRRRNSKLIWASKTQAALGVGLLALLAFTSTSALAELGSWGVAQGVGSVIKQAGGALGKRMFAKNKLVDIEEERSKFFGSIDAQSAGMDPAARESLLKTMELQWANAEMAILMANAQAVRDQKAPVLDLKQVALDVAEGTLIQAQMVGIAGGLGVSDMLGSAAIQGVIAGVDGDQGASAPVWSSSMPIPVGAAPSIGDAATTAAGSVAATGVQDAVAGAVGGAMAPRPSVKGTVELTDDLDPSKFLGRAPAELNAADLYRENGFIGWKRIEQKEAAQIYAPVMPDKVIKAAVYGSDATSGRVVSAFRVLNASVTSFGPLVTQISEREKQTPKYASGGTALRAVWPSGTFLTADGNQVYLGWSEQAAQMFSGAGSAPASVAGAQ